MLSDEQMSNGYPFSLLNDEQMSNKVRVEHQPAIYIYIQLWPCLDVFWPKNSNPASSQGHAAGQAGHLSNFCCRRTSRTAVDSGDSWMYPDPNVPLWEIPI